MGGIFGLLNLDGQPVARESLEAMRESMAFGGGDSASIWQGDNIGLGYLSRHNALEANSASALSPHPASGVVITAQARIDNRDQLIADCRLRIADFSQSAISDGDLILQAYLRWGEECAQHLLGDWAFAIWDPRQRKLFAARDQCGISSFYYYRGPRFFAFASSIKALLALPQIPRRPNLRSIARYLVVEQGDDAQPKFQTVYEDILHLRPAHTLTVTPQTADAEKADVRQYWFLENTSSLHLSSDDEYLEAFLELYTEAVRCRLRSPLLSGEGAGVRSGVGAALSSGLDSSSVCALAARELGARGQRLPAFTAVPIYDTQNTTPRGRYGDETPLVELNRQFIGNLDVHYIRAENVSLLASMARGLELHNRPTQAPSNMFWIYALLEAAQEADLDVLLTGQAGNTTVSWAGAAGNFWPLILAGQWQTLRGKCVRSGLSPWKTVRRYMLRPMVEQTRSYFGRFAPRHVQAAFSPANPQWARSLAPTQGMKVNRRDPFFAPPFDPRRERVERMSNTRNVGAIWAETGFAYGLEARDPTMDKRLMEFCLAIPEEQYRLDGQERALIRRAMKGLLPDEVRLNTRRGLQAADLGYRLLAELPQAQALMARLERSELARQVLDLPKMNGMLVALQKDVNIKTTEECRAVLLNGMMAGLFLLRFDDHGG